MQFNISNFLVGFFLANSIAHLILGIMGIRFLSLFGFSKKANISYSLFCLISALGITVSEGGVYSLVNNSFLLGPIFLYIGFLLIGKRLYILWKAQ